MKKLTIALALAALPLACSNEELGNEEAQVPENVLMHDTLPEAAATPADTAGALTVILTEWNVRLARDTIDTSDGPTRFRARNNGQYPHILEVEGQGQEWMTDTIPPGDWAELEARLQPGTYEVYCPIEGEHGVHEERGMIAHLVVR
jgi:plastocyanin